MLTIFPPFTAVPGYGGDCRFENHVLDGTLIPDIVFIVIITKKTRLVSVRREKEGAFISENLKLTISREGCYFTIRTN